MWFKAVVMEIKKDYAIVLKSDSTIERVKLKDNMKVGDTLLFLEEDVYIKKEKSNVKNKVVLTILSIAAALALVILPMLNKEVSPYAVVSLDINPSIELELDEDKKITKVISLNTDGKKLDLEDIKGLTLEEGINKIKSILEANGYKLMNDSIIVGFAFLGESEDIDYEDYIKQILSKSLDESKLAYLKGNKKDYENATKDGVSIGRYEAKLNVDEDTLEDEIENMSVEEILSLLKNKNVYLNEDVLEELQDELEDRVEVEEENIQSESEEDDQEVEEDDDDDEEDSEDENDDDEDDDNEED